MEMEKKSGFHYAYLIVAAGIAITCVPCSIVLNCAGMFFTPVSTTFNVPVASMSTYLAILSLVMAIYLPFAGKIMGKVDMRVFLTICVLLDGLCLISMSFYTAVWQFYVAAVINGIGTAPLIYLAVPSLVNAWCRKKVGFFVGLCMAFTGIGAAVFNPIASAFITASPEGWRTAYLVFGIVVLVVTLPFTVFIVRSKPEDKGLLPYGYEAVIENADAAAVTPAPGLEANKALKTAAFFAVAAFCGLITLNQTVFQFFPSYVTFLSADAPSLLVYMGFVSSACMIGQALGKIILGALNDRNVILGMAVGIGGGIIGVVMMLLCGAAAVLLLVGSFLFGFAYACTTVQSPLLTRSVFGSKDYTNIYSRVSMVGSLCSAVASVLWGVIVGLPNGFNLMFALSLAVMVVSFILGLFALNQSKKHGYSTVE